jgi:putative polyhydroxyalkanoate system protein
MRGLSAKRRRTPLPIGNAGLLQQNAGTQQERTMSRIYLQREHALDRKTLRKRTEALAKQLKSEYGGDFRWEGDTVHYSYSGGIDARLTLQQKDILVDVKLGVLMLMLKSALTREIERYLDEHLG